MLVVLVVSAMPLALTMNGCAAIVGLDESYELPPDGGVDAADARTTDASLRDATVDSTLPGPEASTPDSAIPAADGATDASVTWQLDDSFGDGGIEVLGTFATSPLPAIPVLPVIHADAFGRVRVAYAAGGDRLIYVCAISSTDGGCAATESHGSPIDFLSYGNDAVLVVTTALGLDAGLMSVLPLNDAGTSYPQFGDCLGGRGLSLVDGGTVTMAAICGTSVYVLSFAVSGATTATIGTFAVVSGVTIFSATKGNGGDDLWLVGHFSTGSALFAHFDIHSGTLLSGGPTEAMGFASDLLALADGGLLAGGTSSALLTAVTSEFNDGAAPPASSQLFGVSPGVLQIEPYGHTRIVTLAPGVNVVVGTLSSAPYLALANVDDQGVSSQSTAQSLPLDGGLSELALGGAVAVDGGLYVALAADLDGGYAIAVARLVAR